VKKFRESVNIWLTYGGQKFAAKYFLGHPVLTKVIAIWRRSRICAMSCRQFSELR